MKKTGIIISTILNILLLPLLLLGSVGIVMGLAASGSNFAQLLFFAYYLFFTLPIISTIGSWVSYKKKNKKVMSYFIALPWVYFVLYLIGLFILFALEKS